MHEPPVDRPGPRESGPPRLSPARTILLATASGLCGGYLDLVAVATRKYAMNELRYFWSGSDFPWSVPVVHAALLAAAGAVVAIVDRVRPGGPMTVRAGAWLFATLAVWSALLRLPLYGVCSLLLAAGLARPISARVVRVRRPGRVLAGLSGLLLLLAAVASARPIVRGIRASRPVPAAPAGARNVILIVWDTVRSPSLSLYGYRRDTSPRLREWARKGVNHALALAPAPWTYPSHSSFFTGRWPYQLDSQWNESLDAPYLTLAEYLAGRGYETVAFVANTRGCSYETGLDRGFAVYEDYPLTPRLLLARTIPGSWILKSLLGRGDFYQAKWIDVLSRDARGINEEFLGWLRRRRRDRPFFAFLNYYDAHSPYVPPPEFAGRFGRRPTSADYRLLFDFTRLAAGPDQRRNFLMARDCYDACVASLDEQLGHLLDAIGREGILDDAMVIITSDHGESFGDHRVFGHGGALYLDQTAVPLVILAPGAPAGRTVAAPVSLRDLPATVVDQVGLSADSPFPGRSLAALWSPGPGGPTPAATPAFSEMAQARAFRPQPGDKRGRDELLQMSLVAEGWHYIRDVRGHEQVYNLGRDPSELVNLAGIAGCEPVLAGFRRTLLDVLTVEPGSSEVERSYLRGCRKSLEAAVEAGPSPLAAAPSAASP